MPIEDVFGTKKCPSCKGELKRESSISKLTELYSCSTCGKKFERNLLGSGSGILGEISLRDYKKQHL